jgi:hypothetical protein
MIRLIRIITLIGLASAFMANYRELFFLPFESRLLNYRTGRVELAITGNSGCGRCLNQGSLMQR